jgi:hypothetical protein
MGRTAGGAKQRLGCTPRALHIYAGHSNWIAHRAVGALARLQSLVVEPDTVSHRVFRLPG